jgi:hypothetical protein
MSLLTAISDRVESDGMTARPACLGKRASRLYFKLRCIPKPPAILRSIWFQGLALLFLTAIVWQFRFVRVGPNLLANDACESISHWSGAPSDASILQVGPNGLVLTKKLHGPSFSLTKMIDRIEGVRFLSVRADVAWENARAIDRNNWAQPRIVIMGQDQQGRFCAPLDHGVLGARGTQPWHRINSVVELPPEMKVARIYVDAYGKHGVLRVNRLRVEAVKQRTWFVPATVVLLGAWALMLSRMLSGMIVGRLPLVRAFALACGILLGTWHFVFPQGRTMFRPFLSEFFLGEKIAPQPAPVPPVVTPPVVPAITKAPDAAAPAVAQNAQRQPRLRTLVPSPGVVPTTPIPAPVDVAKAPPQAPPAAVVVTNQPERRHSMALVQWLRELDRRWNFQKYNFTHFSAFFGIGLYVFLLGGASRLWPLPIAIALLSEIVPNALYGTWDVGDWGDVSANMLGLATAFFLVKWLRARWSALMRRRSAIADLSHPPAASGDA